MANIASSKKDARRSAVRAVRNRGLKSSVKTKITKVRRAVQDGDDEATELGLGAISALDRAAAKAARRKSRLMKRLAAAGAQAKAATPAKTAKKAPAKAPAKKAPARKAPARKKA